MHNGVIVLKDSNVSFEGGVATFKAGERVYDPETIALLSQYGADIAPITDNQ